MRPAYISSAAADACFIETLTAELQRAGFSTFVRVGDTDDWSEEVDDHIREALAVLTVASPGSIHSRQVKYESGFALGAGVAVLPLLLGASEADLHPRLRTLQYLDFTQPSQASWDALIRSLRRMEKALKPVTVQVPRDASPILKNAAEALDGMDAHERAEALGVLGEMNHPGAIEVLAEACRHHPANEVRYRAAIHLAEHKDVRAMPALLDGIRAGFKEIEPWMLGSIGQEAVPALLGALYDENDAVRHAALVQLGRIGGSHAVPPLIARLRNAKADNRWYAAHGLAYAGDTDAIPALIESAQDSDNDVRRASIHALVKCSANAESYEPVLPVFIRALDDEYDQVGINATEGLAHIDDPRAVDALVRAALTNDLEQVRNFARKALESFGRAGAQAIRAAIATGNSLVVTRALRILGRRRDPEDISLFIASTYHQDAEVRQAAIAALWDQPTKEAAPALLERLSDSDPEVRRVAAGALGALRDPDVISQLTASLLDEENDVAEWAANALNNIGTRKALSAVRTWKAKTGEFCVDKPYNQA